MTNILLEANQFGIFEQLVNYGALGLVVLALGAVGWYMFKRNMAEKDAMQAKINELEKELRDRK
jgi:hypothetical protein